MSTMSSTHSNTTTTTTSTNKSPTSPPNEAAKSEEELSRKWDRCIADSLLKTSAGLAIGVVASFALFKGRTFPIWLGTGIGKIRGGPTLHLFPNQRPLAADGPYSHRTLFGFRRWDGLVELPPRLGRS